MARKTNGSAVRSKKIVPPSTESISPVPAAAQVSTELSANTPAPVVTTPVAVTPAAALPVTVTPVATPVAASPVTATKTASNGNKPSVTTPNGDKPNVAKPNGNGADLAKLNLDEEIRRRAYELFLQRNGSTGDPNRDWLVAENEVKARHAVAGR